MEPVYAKRGPLRWLQRLAVRLCSALRDEYDPRRETHQLIRAAGFQNVEMEEFDAVELTKPNSIMPGIVLIRPHISGTATK